jgi:hypothetical protein
MRLGVAGVDGKDVFQADALVVRVIGDRAKPKPGQFVALIALDCVE